MSTRITRADIIEVPLPTDVTDNLCMPLVVMQPTADASDYMLKPNYATNGRPGVVDHAVLADQANTVIWNQITNLPATFPPSTHGPQHLNNGNDPVPIATPALDGMCPKGSGSTTDYLGGDIVFRALPNIVYYRSEGDATIDAAFVAGAVIYSGVVPNPAYGVYFLEEGYLFNANQSYPPAGKVHFDVFDTLIPGWVAVTDSTEINVMNTDEFLLRPNLNSLAMTRVWNGPPNSLQWRLVLDQPAGVPSYFRVGMAFLLTGKTTPVP
jgi:hypothetical protein